MAGTKEHKVQVIAGDVRYVATERDGRVRFTRDGDEVGTAKWSDDSFHESNALLPDAVERELARKLNEACAADYFD